MKNRRFGSNVILKVLSGISIISWTVLAVIILYTAGNPVTSGIGVFLQKLKGAAPVTMIKVYGVLMFTAFISFSGIFVNLFRMKRRSDKLRLTPVISGILSVAGLIFMNMK